MFLENKTMFAIILGFLLDLVLGDPQNKFHPIRIVGNLIYKFIDLYKKLNIKNKKIQFVYGIFMNIFTIMIFYFLIYKIILWGYKFDFNIGFFIEMTISYFVIATKSLYLESMNIKNELLNHNLIGARKKLSYIVGRDTQNLDQEKIIKATVETVAENLCDGVIAPLFFMLVGGVPVGFAYKVVNTFDSMVGYRNETFEYLGKFSAKLDDIANFIPSRLSAFCMILSTIFLKLDTKNAIKIYFRDKKNHMSPNSAQTESVCAGALNIQLGGDSRYNTKLVRKPTIGDNTNTATPENIKDANLLIIFSAILFLYCSIFLILLFYYFMR